MQESPREYTTLVDFSHVAGRDRDVVRPSDYPFGVQDAQGILVREERFGKSGRALVPAYQQMPSGLLEVAAEQTEGELGDALKEEVAAQYEALGLNGPAANMYGLRKLVHGLNSNDRHGQNLYLSTLMLSGDLSSKEPHAIELSRAGERYASLVAQGWHYLFMPGTFDIGTTERTLRAQDRTLLCERLAFSIPMETVYTSVLDCGIHMEAAGLLMPDGKVVKTHKGWQPIASAFPKKARMRNHADTAYKTIDLDAIVRGEGLEPVPHAFAAQVAAYEGIHVFRPAAGPWDAEVNRPYSFAQHAATQTGSAIWKLAALMHFVGDPNGSFLRYALGAQFKERHLVFFAHAADRGVPLGDSGRTVRVSGSKGTGFPREYAPERLSMRIDRNMIAGALFSLGDRLREIQMAMPPYEAPWEVVYAAPVPVLPMGELMQRVERGESPREASFEYRGPMPKGIN